MSPFARWTAALLTLGFLATAGPGVRAGDPWMTEEAMRAAFIGKTLDGHYADGLTWSETYKPDGRLDYKERTRASGGYWYFRGHVFCTFYDPGQGLNGGCFTAVRTGANCYEFYLAGLSEREAEEADRLDPLRRWVARASRRGEPPTCEAQPTV